MPETQSTQKALEVKIRVRTIQERQDQKDVSRVFFSKDALLELRLEAGKPCYLWKMDVPEARCRQVIAWPSPQALNKNVVQMAKTLQEAYGLRLEDRCSVAPCGELLTAECVVLRDTTIGASGVSEKDRPHWEWYLEDKLYRAEHVFHGMVFEVNLRGPKRTFVVESFLNNGSISLDSMTKFEESSTVKITNETIASQPQAQRPPLQVANIEGIDRALLQLNRFLAKFDRESWARNSCGVLIHGAQGTGKTMLLDQVCRTGWGKVFRIDAQTKAPGLRDIFKNARQNEPSIITIDNIEAIVSKEHGKSHELEVILGEEMDNLITKLPSGGAPPRVIIAATSSTLNELPTSLRKPGRFTKDIMLSVPDIDARKKILRSLVPDATTAETVLLERLGERTHAYTPQDLVLLLREAYDIAGERTLEKGLAQEDFDEALLYVRPTAMHDVTLRPPKVRWSEIGGQEHVKRALRRALEAPLRHPELIQRLGITPKKGLLLYGPPGCSKTLSAQAIATEVGFNFFAVKGAELLNMYVGESERAVREVFARARAASPSIIFFDEIESIGSKRQAGKNNGVNVLTTLLNEMDGIETLKGVTVLAATNQPEALDLALLRPGRFDDLLYVAPPGQGGREAILHVWKNKMDWADDVDIPNLAQLADGYSGAEIVAICQKAGDMVFETSLDTGSKDLQIHMTNLLDAMKTVKKQITPALVEKYKRWAAGDR